jgi:hypothetical protein
MMIWLAKHPTRRDDGLQNRLTQPNQRQTMTVRHAQHRTAARWTVSLIDSLLKSKEVPFLM